jgi:Tfp pilus assembly protein PilW
MKASILPWVSRHQCGIGLVEIMVALTLGLVLMGGVSVDHEMMNK